MPYAKKVIEEHGGEIGVESSPGAGTLVTVRLPADTEGA
jgi:signal transduction histidine kinase